MKVKKKALFLLFLLSLFRFYLLLHIPHSAPIFQSRLTFFSLSNQSLIACAVCQVDTALFQVITREETRMKKSKTTNAAQTKIERIDLG